MPWLFLGGMISHIKSNGGSVSLNTDTLIPALQANLEQNGFLFEMGEDVSPWDGNSVPYREDREPDLQKISRYLQEKWIGKGWLNIHPDLIEAIVSNVLEIYSNAFTHGFLSKWCLQLWSEISSAGSSKDHCC